MPKIMKKVQQMRTILPIGRSDDKSVCTTSLRPGARLITLYTEVMDNSSIQRRTESLILGSSEMYLQHPYKM